MDALIIILAGILVAVSCGLLGSFMILRKMTMLGDAISHAVLPGIVISYLVSSSRDVFFMLSGAIIIGIITTVIIEWLYNRVKLQSDAAIGFTFTTLFAIGVILISYFAGQVDLDQDCVLYGEILFIPLGKALIINGINLGPQTLWGMGLMLILILVFLYKGWRGLVITTFNPDYAKSIGISTSFWQYLLMIFVASTTVVSFESVGAILVVGFLIVPPASAYLLTTDLRKMLMLMTVFSVLSAVLGYYLSYLLNASVTGAMITVSGILFSLSFIVSKLKKQNRQST
jgi:manganese/zinc/iron transport system permease protein